MLERGLLLFKECSAFGPFLLALKGQTWRMSHLGQLGNATIATEMGIVQKENGDLKPEHMDRSEEKTRAVQVSGEQPGPILKK